MKFVPISLSMLPGGVRRWGGRNEILLNNHLNSNEIFSNSIEGFTFFFHL